MKTWIYNTNGECIGQMDEYYVIYNGAGYRAGCVNPKTGEIFGPYDNYVGYVSKWNEICNPMGEVCGYVNDNGDIFDLRKREVGYVTETDEYNRMREGITDVFSLIAGAAAWLLNF